jgi:hypothetical protein
MTPAANLSPVSTTPTVNFDTYGKFATGIKDTGVKFVVANNVNNIRLLTYTLK